MTPTDTITISVVIVNFNVRYLLEQCLLSLRRGIESLKLQIIVVDNASSDNSINYLKERFPEVEFVALAENMGFAKANNIGLAKCIGEYILILNPDTVLVEDTLPKLTDFLKSNPSCGLVTPKLIRKDGALDLACRRALPTPWVAFSRISGLSNIFPKSKLFSQYNLTYLDCDQPARIGSLTGAFMLMPSEVYRKVGGFDEQFFMYGEDIDFCARAAQAGYEIHYRPEATAIHYRGESTRRSSLDRTDVFYNAMLLYARKHYRGGSKKIGLPLLQTGIFFAKAGSQILQGSRLIWPVMLDAVLIAIALNFGQLLRWGSQLDLLLDFRVLVAYIIFVVLSLTAAGAYSESVKQLPKAAFKGTVLGSFVAGTYTFFLLQGYMFSRLVVLISALLWCIFLPGWRFLLLQMAKTSWARGLLRRSAIIVGTDSLAKSIGEQFQHQQGEYEIVGFVRYRNEVVDSSFGYDPLGSTDELDRIVETERVSDVFFSTGGASYAEIVALANRLAPQGVHFKVLSAEAPGSALPLFGVDWQTPIGIRGLMRRVQRRWGL